MSKTNKASEDADAGSSTTPKAIAQSFFSLLYNAIALFMAELKRAFRLLRQAESSGSQEPLMIPPELFMNILKFLPRRDIVVRASLVSKAWLSATRNSAMWDTFDYFPGQREMNMIKFVALLRRPQFSKLKVLIPPPKLKFGNFGTGFRKIASACPLVETVLAQASYYMSDECLLTTADCFPHLRSISLRMCDVSGGGVSAFAKAMGSRLKELMIVGSSKFLMLVGLPGYAPSEINDEVLKDISEHCPNLEKFTFTSWWDPRYPSGGGFSHEGLIHLFEGCPNLRKLSLLHAPNVGVEAFEYLRDKKHSLTTLSVAYLKCLATKEGLSLCEELKEKIPNLDIDHNRNSDAATVTYYCDAQGRVARSHLLPVNQPLTHAALYGRG
jgi:hypothetical protein